MVTETAPASGWARKILACLAILVVSVVGIQAVSTSAVLAQSPDSQAAIAAGENRPQYTDGGECISPTELKAAEGEQTAAQEDRLKLLPLNRWGGATSNLHSRLGAKVTDDVRQRLSRDLMQSTMMSLGDSLWSITGGLVTFATEYSVLDKAGCTADAASAALGNALLGGIAPIFVGVGLILALWRARQGAENPTRKIAGMVAVLGLFGVLLNGANQTAATNRISPGSPGYIAVTLDGIVTAVAASPTEAMNENMPTAGAFGTSGDQTGDGADCANYIATLRERYSSGDAAYSDAKARIPVAISAMWEQSGLRSFANVQFGSKNPYGQASYCRYLERVAGIPVAEQQELLAASGGPSGGVNELFAGGNNKTEDQAGVFWAACGYSGGWSIRGDWGSITGTDGLPDDVPTAEDCSSVFGDWEGASKPEHGFEWSDSPDNIEKRTVSAPDARDFMLNWHGDAVTNGLAVSFVYVVSSGIILLVFGMISVGIIIAKSVGVVMVVMIFLMLAMALIPSQGENNKLVKFFKFWLGMTFYSAGLMFILALVALITAFVNQVGMESFGEGSLMSILWMGFAPVTAIILLHVVFKHAVGIPSPFKPGAALAFGGTLAGAGAALGIGVDRMARRSRGMASGYGRGMAHRAGYNRVAGEKRGKGRDQKMPVGGVGGAAAGAGVGAGVVGAGAGGGPGDGGMAPGMVHGPGGSGGSGDEAPASKPSLRERLAAANDMGWGERARQAARVPREALDRMKERWKADGGPRRLVKRTGVAGAALTWAGIGGAATVAASTAAPIVAAAVGARALHRARDRYKDRVAGGEASSARAAAVARSNERVNEYRARLTARQQAADDAAAEPTRRAAAAANYRRERQEAERAWASGFDVPMPTDPDGRGGGGFGGAGGPRPGRPGPDGPDGGSGGSGGPSRGPGAPSGPRPSGGAGTRPEEPEFPRWGPDPAPSSGSHSRRPHSRPVRPPR